MRWLLLWCFGLCYLARVALHVPFPKEDGDVIYYFREEGIDLKYLVARVLQKAARSIHISTYGLTDPDIVSFLEKTPHAVHISYDPKEHNLLPSKAHLYPHTKSGLMHRKLIAIDETLVFLGSTNLTPMALHIHHNLIVGIRSPLLFQAIQENRSLTTPSFSYHPLPDKTVLPKLLAQIDHANRRIYLCLYTLTHPQIIASLQQAHARGVELSLYLDKSMALGSCRKSLPNLPIHIQADPSLLHHKCALIDDTFIFGSANWSKAGFGKNQEYLLFLPASPTVESFFKTLKTSCIPISFYHKLQI